MPHPAVEAEELQHRERVEALHRLLEVAGARDPHKVEAVADLGVHFAFLELAGVGALSRLAVSLHLERQELAVHHLHRRHQQW